MRKESNEGCEKNQTIHSRKGESDWNKTTSNTGLGTNICMYLSYISIYSDISMYTNIYIYRDFFIGSDQALCHWNHQYDDDHRDDENDFVEYWFLYHSSVSNLSCPNLVSFLR